MLVKLETRERRLASCQFTGMRDKNLLHSYVHVLALSLNSVQCSLKATALSNGVTFCTRSELKYYIKAEPMNSIKMH